MKVPENINERIVNIENFMRDLRDLGTQIDKTLESMDSKIVGLRMQLNNTFEILDPVPPKNLPKISI